MDEKEKAFASYAAEVLKAQSADELQNKLQNLSNEELDGLVSEFEQMWNNQEQPMSAKLGAKLKRVMELNGVCPEGYEMKVFKMGGKVCKKCMEAQKGAKLPNKQTPADEFKNSKKPAKKSQADWDTYDGDETGPSNYKPNKKDDDKRWNEKKKAMSAKKPIKKNYLGGIIINENTAKEFVDRFNCGGSMKPKKEKGGEMKGKGKVYVTSSPQDSKRTKPTGGWESSKERKPMYTVKGK